MNSNDNTFNGNVLSAINTLNRAVTDYRGGLMDSISELAKARQLNKVGEIYNQAEKVDSFLNLVCELETQWLKITNGNEKEFEENDNEKEVAERTSWAIVGNNIRIETKRIEGPPYSNVFSLSLFKEITRTAISIIEKNNWVKTSEVEKILGKKIMAGSDYKKTPRIPVYATFKVLVKENLFKIDTNNSHRYLISNSKASLINWLDDLK